MSDKLYPSRPVLVVDDEPVALKSIIKILESSGINNTIACEDGREVEEIIRTKDISTILLDLSMPNISGSEVLMIALEINPDIPVIITTGDSEIKSVVNCMREGAFDYITKPLIKDRLINSVTQAIDVSEIKNEENRIGENLTSTSLKNPHVFSRILTKSEKMKNIFRYCEAIAQSHNAILIQGEPGTGKETIAKAIHELSERPGPFVVIDGSDEQAVTELFDSSDSAALQEAKNGTLYLKNVSEISIAHQIKLLALLDSKIVSSTSEGESINLIISSKVDLEMLHKTSRFRADLYLRLNSHSFTIPPLRERPEDLPILLSAFIDKAAFLNRKKIPAYHRDLVTLLKSYHFPENISQLYKMCFEAVKKHKSRMLSNLAFKDNMGRYEETGNEVDIMTKTAIEILCSMKELPKMKELCDGLLDESVRRSNGNQRVAALMLGISPQTMGNRIKKLRDDQKKKAKKKKS